MMTRHQVREHLNKLLYMNEFAGDDMPSRMSIYLDEIESLGEDERWALETRYDAIVKCYPEIDGKITQTAKGWRIDRMSRVDLSILRLAVYELVFDDSIPDGVAINEAVELAKAYGGEESSSFINGILGVIAAEKNE